MAKNIQTFYFNLILNMCLRTFVHLTVKLGDGKCVRTAGHGVLRRTVLNGVNILFHEHECIIAFAVNPILCVSL